ncbi:hypothetical protein Y032_0050g1951 [Ancylostoma ceylanicum]|uniref:Uncharacterized protein n=1 Tax=Ancylostoma ceylanicum TaxID=53326 RepID=A0A016U875_9BILA|nr:hypothetical protein Y032_0050g1951 [Ancylostoma ceylanicum]
MLFYIQFYGVKVVFLVTCLACSLASLWSRIHPSREAGKGSVVVISLLSMLKNLRMCVFIQLCNNNKNQ